MSPGVQGEGSDLIYGMLGPSTPRPIKREGWERRSSAAFSVGCFAGLQAGGGGASREAARRSHELRGLGSRTPPLLVPPGVPVLGQASWRWLVGTWLFKGRVAAQRGQGCTQDLCCGRISMSAQAPGTQAGGVHSSMERVGVRGIKRGHRPEAGMPQTRICKHAIDTWV